eukprot:CAMPEP_0170640200 /NCGR_PEP_ID=MMETSP0224-20130122/40082_1 /TAXON_ID=285029 /ORGANISM="Togula jolla, Strain CCCM 725" /LENGTH=40 /DNA_ID= /DNA_START= /DNA_END= /DNA_ORIENTATION=
MASSRPKASPCSFAGESIKRIVAGMLSSKLEATSAMTSSG